MRCECHSQTTAKPRLIARNDEAVATRARSLHPHLAGDGGLKVVAEVLIVEELQEASPSSIGTTTASGSPIVKSQISGFFTGGCGADVVGGVADGGTVCITTEANCVTACVIRSTLCSTVLVGGSPSPLCAAPRPRSTSSARSPC